MDRRPFVPIRVHSSDGTTYDIRQPEMDLLTRSTVEIGLSGTPDGRIADEIAY